MEDIILHHYPVSHYAEKIRCILGYKNLSWYSVEQPIMMPKPFLTPLTGGYRRIPVMQVGADIYCDTSCILRRIEALYPEPPVLSAQWNGLSQILEDWVDRRFMWQALLPGFVDLADFLPPDVMDDRAKMSPELTKDNFFKGAPHALSQAILSMDKLESMLQDKPFLLGDRFSVVDASCYFVMFFLSNSPRVFEPAIARTPLLKTWMERIKAFGHGFYSEMSNETSLAIAGSHVPLDVEAGLGEITGFAMTDTFKVGDEISVAADDYGTETVQGTLVGVTVNDIAILRRDAELGEIAVHFPRNGYKLSRL